MASTEKKKDESPNQKSGSSGGGRKAWQTSPSSGSVAEHYIKKQYPTLSESVAAKISKNAMKRAPPNSQEPPDWEPEDDGIEMILPPGSSLGPIFSKIEKPTDLLNSTYYPTRLSAFKEVTEVEDKTNDSTTTKVTDSNPAQ